MPESEALADRLLSAQLDEPAQLVDAARAARFTDANPLDFAVPAITLAIGDPTEHRAYAYAHPPAVRAAAAALCTTRNLVAAALVRREPRVERIVLRHPAFVKKVEHGPLARMPAEARTIRLVSKLLLDAVEFERLHRRGYFAWDDGSAQLAMSVDYAWRHTVAPRAWMTQKPRSMRFEAQGTIRRILREQRADPLGRTVGLRYFQTFYGLTDKRIATHERELRSLAGDPAVGAGTTLLASYSLLELGVRTERPELIRDAITHVTSRHSELDGHRSLLPPTAWAAVFDGKPGEASEITTSVLRSRSPRVKSQAIILLQRLGEPAKAGDLHDRLITLEQERSDA